jgi:dihydrodipicolinate synthase/N-acetylneuraminate lyase
VDIGWEGVFPALTTQFRDDESLDLEAIERHVEHLIDTRVDGLVVLGSLGENSTLCRREKLDVVRRAAATAHGRVPVLAGVAETTTRTACEFAIACARAGATGLMVLPSPTYGSDRRETLLHHRSVAAAGELPVMICNDPIAYRVDMTPEMMVALAEMETIVAIKDATADVRRVTDLVNAFGNRFAIFAGVDDLALESVLLGARGFVAGLVNAFPHETVAMFDHALGGRWEEAREMYRWFMPLLHLDAHDKLVQYIKYVQSLVGLGSEAVRAPRLPLVGDERDRIRAIVEAAQAARPTLR